MSKKESLSSNTYEVEMEIEVRKYPVPKEKLKKVLRSHKALSNEEIANRLNKPKTMVEHWFRADGSFSIPDADIWFELKKLLNIETDEFDKAITTFETRGGNYDLRNRIYAGEIAPTLMRGSESNLHLVKTYDARGNGDGKVCCTITGAHQSTISDYTAILLEAETMEKSVFDGNRRHDYKEFGETSETVMAHYGTRGGNTPIVVEKDEPIVYRGDAITSPVNASNPQKGDPCHTLTDDSRNYVVKDGTEEMKTIVRRLTPLECERLQGYPDGWTDIGDWVDSKGKKHKGESDAPRYKALGNSIALPFWQWMAARMAEVLRSEGEETPTMASLFDGIGGFPLVFSRCGCKPIWASEIEEFPIAVTKIRFPEEEDNDKNT